ncbi:MAG: hypothetical protein LIQ31_12520, partial [Planctomycetes bacterium]|nr:hypothetical protein [Planctomycetota bacterium]
RFTAALAKAVAWLTQHGGDECRDVAAKYWPDLPADKAVALIDRYRQAGMWEGTAIPDRALARWQGFMADSLLVEKPLEYGEIVDVRPQEFAAGQEGGARHG